MFQLMNALHNFYAGNLHAALTAVLLLACSVNIFIFYSAL
jgi:hypothetical protein